MPPPAPRRWASATRRCRSRRRCAASPRRCEPVFAGTHADTTEENIQSRARGIILMALSNKFGGMVVTTGNKSEMSVGYATLYGDMNGGYNPIKDLYKMEVYRLARWRNRARAEGRQGAGRRGHPARTSSPRCRRRSCARTRPTRTRCRPTRCSTTSSCRWSRRRCRSPTSSRAGIAAETVKKIERLLYLAEYKRRQAPPGVKISSRNFGRDRRYPIVNKFRETL